jgi:hypothetical protein
VTFAQWYAKYNPQYAPATHNGAIVVHDTVDLIGSGARSHLFGLSDYLVSSVTGGCLWLIPREKVAA